MLRRSPFKRKTRPIWESKPISVAKIFAPKIPLHPQECTKKAQKSHYTPPSASMAPRHTAAPRPKPTAWRNRRLLDMAEGRPCLLHIPGVCNHDPATTVAAHSNLSIHGKGAHRKADDVFTVWACANCHAWLDQGPAPKADKEAAFVRAHADQVLAWRRIANDPHESEPDRRAARAALERLEALP